MLKEKFAGIREKVVANRGRIAAFALPIVVAGVAGSAFAADPTGSTGASGLGLDTMITSSGAFIRDLITTNSGPLMTALLPILGFVFVKNQVRSIF